MPPDKIYFIVFGVFAVVIGYDIFNWIRYRSFSTPEFKLLRLRSTTQMLVFTIGVTLLLISICFHINIFDYQHPIEYSHIKSITLKDFRGYNVPGQTLDGDAEFAFIETSIDWSRTDNGIEIKSLFHPSRSYVFNENVNDRFLLEHELYHFHIAEYFARQCRKEVLDLNVIPSDDLVDEIVSRQRSLEKIMQMEYDDETYHGYVRKAQKKWMDKVDSLLNSRLDFQISPQSPSI